MSNNKVHNSLPIFTKFCVQLGNVVSSMSGVSDRKQKQISDFIGAQILTHSVALNEKCKVNNHMWGIYGS